MLLSWSCFFRVVVLKVSGLEGCRVLGFQGCRVLVLELFLFTNGGAAGFYIPKRFRKPHFSEFKGSRISVLELSGV